MLSFVIVLLEFPTSCPIVIGVKTSFLKIRKLLRIEKGDFYRLLFLTASFQLYGTRRARQIFVKQIDALELGDLFQS